MKNLKTFEQFTNEYNDELNEGLWKKTKAFFSSKQYQIDDELRQEILDEYQNSDDNEKKSIYNRAINYTKINKNLIRNINRLSDGESDISKMITDKFIVFYLMNGGDISEGYDYVNEYWFTTGKILSGVHGAN